MVYKYAGKELELLYFSLRNTLHIEGYYDGALDFDEVERHFGKLNSYIREIEELKQD